MNVILLENILILWRYMSNPKNAMQILIEKCYKDPKFQENYYMKKLEFYRKKIECLDEAIENCGCSITRNKIEQDYQRLIEDYDTARRD